MGDLMEVHVTWSNLLIVAAVMAILLMILAVAWRMLKRFLIIWLLVVFVLVGLKLAADAGLIG
jgi:hypothetical protein